MIEFEVKINIVVEIKPKFYVYFVNLRNFRVNLIIDLMC